MTVSVSLMTAPFAFGISDSCFCVGDDCSVMTVSVSVMTVPFCINDGCLSVMAVPFCVSDGCFFRCQ